jgi:WD40 repeat protein
VKTGAEAFTIRGFNADVVSVLFTPDGTTLLALTFDGMIRFYHAGDGSYISSFTTDVSYPLTLSMDAASSQLGVGGMKTGKSYDANPGRTYEPNLAYVSLSGGKVVFNPAGSMFAAVVDNGTSFEDLVLIDLQSGDSTRLWQSQEHPVNSLVFNPDGTLLATAGTDGIIKVWGVNPS